MNLIFIKNLFYSFLLAGVVFVFPWETIYPWGLMLSDYGTHFRHLEADSWYAKEYTLAGIFNLSNQDLFKYLMFNLKLLLDDPKLILGLISGFIMFVWAYFCSSRKINIFFACLFLFHPFAIDMLLHSIRNGIAFTLVILAVMIQTRIISYPLILFAPFWHVTAAAGLLFYTIKDFVIDKLNTKTVIATIIILTGVSIGIFPTIFGETLYSLVPDRSQYVYLRSLEDNLIGREVDSAMMLLILTLMMISPKEYIKKHSFIALILVWFTVLNLMIPFANRLWAGFIPFLAYAVWEMRKEFKFLIIGLWVPYIILSYGQWTGFLLK